MRQTADVEVQLLVGDGANVARLALENDRRLVLARRAKVPVEAVFGDVQRAPDEPLRVRRLPLEDLLERLAPDEMLVGHALPEGFWSIDRLGMELLVSSHTAKVGLALKLSSWFEHPFFTGHGSDVFIRHVEVLV